MAVKGVKGRGGRDGRVAGKADVGGGVARPAVVSGQAAGVRAEVVKEVERPWRSRDEAPSELKDWWDATPEGREEVRSVFMKGMNEWVAVSNDGGTGSGFLWQVMHPKKVDAG